MPAHSCHSSGYLIVRTSRGHSALCFLPTSNVAWRRRAAFLSYRTPSRAPISAILYVLSSASLHRSRCGEPNVRSADIYVETYFQLFSCSSSSLHRFGQFLRWNVHSRLDPIALYLFNSEHSAEFTLERKFDVIRTKQSSSYTFTLKR